MSTSSTRPRSSGRWRRGCRPIATSSSSRGRTVRGSTRRATTDSAPRWGSTRRSRSGRRRCASSASACPAKRRLIPPRCSIRARRPPGARRSHEAGRGLRSGHRQRPLRRRSGGAAGHASRRDPAFALCPCRIARHRRGRGTRAAGRRLRRHRRGCAALVAALRGGAERRERAVVRGDRPGALCRRAGGGRRIKKKTPRRGRDRGDRRRLCAAAGGARSAPGGAGQRPPLPLRRSGGGLRRGAAPGRGDGSLSAQCRDADRGVRRHPEYRPGDGSYDVAANFQGPFAMHAVMALALKVPANRLRLRTPPDSGGSFGAKHAVFPYVVLLALAARKAGRPVKWVETRLEHLSAATSATGRATTLSAAVAADGLITALDWDQIEDCGAYLRAPEPATLYRMHGNLSGAYRVPNLAVRNRIVLTNKTPSGLVRGFGGPQVYFALERLVARIAATLGMDPLAVIRRNLVARFPHRCPAGAVLDSGDYRGAVDEAAEQGGLAELYRRRAAARAAGRLYGIGYAAVVEPSISNMGYSSTVLSPAERR